MGDMTHNEELAMLAKEFVDDYKDNQCEKIIDRMEQLKVNSPFIFQNAFIRDVYINTHFKYGSYLMKEGQFERAKEALEELLEYENEFILDNELSAYELYSKLVDAYSMCQEHEKATQYNKKAKQLIKKMMAAKEVQNIYLLMTEGSYRAAINLSKRIDNDMLDDYNKARMNMVLGNAHFNMRHYKTAVDFLTRALEYYEEKTYNSLTVLMYEELSKCYSNLDEHILAVEYMQKAKSFELERHQARQG